MFWGKSNEKIHAGEVGGRPPTDNGITTSAEAVCEFTNKKTVQKERRKRTKGGRERRQRRAERGEVSVGDVGEVERPAAEKSPSAEDAGMASS